jgi:hypothetical protein
MPKMDESLSGSQLLHQVADELYHLGVMLLGESEATVTLVERTIATTELSGDSAQAGHSACVALAATAIEMLSQQDAQALAAPTGEYGPPNCIGDDDLDAAGVSVRELEEMVSGPGRVRMRTWLEGLPVAERTIFVLRTVGRLSTPEVAGLLALHGGKAAQGWMTDAVRGVFRQALCALASQLLQDSNSR